MNVATASRFLKRFRIRLIPADFMFTRRPQRGAVFGESRAARSHGNRTTSGSLAGHLRPPRRRVRAPPCRHLLPNIRSKSSDGTRDRTQR